MKRYLLTAVAFFCLVTAATAQINPAMNWNPADRHHPLPPLRGDFNMDLFNRFLRPKRLLMSPVSTAHTDTIDHHSIMYHPSESHEMTFHGINPGHDYMPSGDTFLHLRDRIVRERRRKEGNPLPPPPPRTW